MRGTDERDKLKVTDILNNVMGKNEKKKSKIKEAEKSPLLSKIRMNSESREI